MKKEFNIKYSPNDATRRNTIIAMVLLIIGMVVVIFIAGSVLQVAPKNYSIGAFIIVLPALLAPYYILNFRDFKEAKGAVNQYTIVVDDETMPLAQTSKIEIKYNPNMKYRVLKIKSNEGNTRVFKIYNEKDMDMAAQINNNQEVIDIIQGAGFVYKRTMAGAQYKRAK